VTGFGGVRWRRAGLYREGEVGITGTIGRLHQRITGQRGRDPELLLRPVNVSNAVPRRRLNQSAEPDSGTEDETGVAGLIAACACAEGREDRPVPAVTPDSQVGQPHLRQCYAQLMQRCDHWVGARHFLGNQLVLDVRPVTSQQCERIDVNGNTGVLHSRRRRHVAAT
jgi:hypothetical protein